MQIQIHLLILGNISWLKAENFTRHKDTLKMKSALYP